MVVVWEEGVVRRHGAHGNVGAAAARAIEPHYPGCWYHTTQAVGATLPTLLEAPTRPLSDHSNSERPTQPVPIARVTRDHCQLPAPHCRLPETIARGATIAG